jgi:predicted nucleic acid-binding protein
MSAEFVDTNIFIYAHDSSAGRKHQQSIELLARLFEEISGALSVQVLSEFYAAATRNLGMESQAAEDVIRDLRGWTIHSPAHADVLQACGLQRRYKIAWWDAMIVNSAVELGCSVLWTEDLSNGRRFGTLTARNPF